MELWTQNVRCGLWLEQGQNLNSLRRETRCKVSVRHTARQVAQHMRATVILCTLHRFQLPPFVSSKSSSTATILVVLAGRCAGSAHLGVSTTTMWLCCFVFPTFKRPNLTLKRPDFRLQLHCAVFAPFDNILSSHAILKVYESSLCCCTSFLNLYAACQLVHTAPDPRHICKTVPSAAVALSICGPAGKT